MASSLHEQLRSSDTLRGLADALRGIRRDATRIRWLLRRPALCREYLASHEVRKLHIGCGRNLLPGWLNTDLSPNTPDAVHLDATRRFPFDDAAFDFVFSEHIIEHVPFDAGQAMLGECLRVLKPGGILRVSTPDLRQIAGLMSPAANGVQRRYIEIASAKYIPANTARLPGFVVNNFYWDFGHYFVYDPDTLRLALDSAGFTSVVQAEVGASTHTPLRDLETHGDIVGDEINRFETMVFEAARPS